MNKGIQNLAANPIGEDDEVSCYKDSKYAMVSNEVQRQLIRERIDKNPKNFSPYDFDALYKIVLIGESDTGKTSMLLQFADNIFTENYLCTIGVDFKIKTLKIDNKIIKM
jgi:polynucleotide 5'-kinase involved in rRNA processing